MSKTEKIALSHEIDKLILSDELKALSIQKGIELKKLSIDDYVNHLVERLIKRDFCNVVISNKLLRVKTQGCELFKKYWYWYGEEQLYRIKVILIVDSYQVDNAEILETYEQ